jgi:glycosyltransferase involved in cell wall biosynthesis
MHKSFVSIVGVVNHRDELDQLPEYLKSLHGVLQKSFSDFEIILVNNTSDRRNQWAASLPGAIKQNIFLLSLSSVVNKNHATLAGLDRANGDYTVLFELEFRHRPELVVDLFEKAAEGFDIVYLQARQRRANVGFAPFYKLFYYILKRYSDLKIDEKAHNTRIVSRRALNSVLRLRENLRYMKAIYSMVGYPTASIQVEEPLKRDPHERFSDQFRTSLVAIASFTTFLRSVLLWIFLFSLFFLAGVVANALKVRFTQVDLFGQYHETVSGGWTFLVVMISIFFAITCLNLYIMSIYLSNIYFEIKQRPLYIIESVKRL